MMLFPIRRLGAAGILIAVASAVAAVLGVLFAFTIAAPKARAQRTLGDTVSFLYTKGNDTIATERVVRTAEGIAGMLTIKGQARLGWRQQITATGDPGAFDLDAFGPGTPADAKPIQSVTLRMIGDSGFVDIHANGTTTTQQRMALPAGAQWMLNTSLTHTAVLAGIALQRQKTALTIVLVQGGQQLPLSVKPAGDTIIITIAGSEARFIQDARGLREAVFAAQGLVVRRISDDEVSRAAKPPSYAAPADAPYTAEDVVIPTPKGHVIAATLTRPKGEARMPVVITISGSGQQDRDETISIVNGFRPFREIADTLGRRGIAVLRWDDEGVGGSGGDPLNGTSADFAEDVHAIAAWLRARGDIDGNRIGLVGHSEGGMIAPMVAATDSRIRAVALMAGPAYTGRRILRYQLSGAMSSTAGVVYAPDDATQNAGEAGTQQMMKQSAWTRYFVAHDPVAVAGRVKQPVLILQGLTDHQITPEQADILADAFRLGGNHDVTVRKIADANHLFLRDSDGRGAGYASLKSSSLASPTLSVLADWFVAKLK